MNDIDRVLESFRKEWKIYNDGLPTNEVPSIYHFSEDFLKSALEQQQKSMTLKSGAIVARLEDLIPPDIDIDYIAKAIVNLQKENNG